MSPLRGSFPAKIDGKGRLRVPAVFRDLIHEQYGTELFVTSTTGEFVRVYPMPVWIALEAKLATVPSTHPSRGRYLDRVSFFGQPADLDKQGRVLIHPRLRESASMTGDVDVFGQFNYLDVWNHDRRMAKFHSDPLTDDDLRTLAGFGI